MGSIDMTSIELPVVLRDRIRDSKLHHGQPYYEVIEAALEYWEDAGGWLPGWQRFTDDPKGELSPIPSWASFAGPRSWVR